MRRAIQFMRRGERGSSGNPRIAMLKYACDVGATTGLASWFLNTVFSDGGLNRCRRRCFVSDKNHSAYSVAHEALSIGVLWHAAGRALRVRALLPRGLFPRASRPDAEHHHGLHGRIARRPTTFHLSFPSVSSIPVSPGPCIRHRL